MIDDPNIVLYVKETKESFNCYYVRNPNPSTIEIDKVLYMYYKGMFTMELTSIFLDKFGITYEPMEQRIALGIT